MLGLQVYVDVQYVEIVPTPKNVLNELDSVSIVMGIDRYLGEKSKYFKSEANRIAVLGYDKPEQQQLQLGLELRSKSEFLVLECTSTSNRIIKADVFDDFRYKITTYFPPSIISTDLYNSSSFTYDLFDRCTYPFLEELVADTTKNIDGIRSYIAPTGHGRYNHILPYHLAPVQKNYLTGLTLAQESTSFYLDHRFIIPDSLEVFRGDLPSTIPLNVVQSTNEVTSPGDVHVDYWTGKVTASMIYDTSGIKRKNGIVSVLDGTGLSKFNVSFSYLYVNPISRFILTPNSTIINYTDTSIATRINTYDDPNCEIKKHRYQYAADNIQEGYIYSGSKISDNLAFVFERGKLKDFNLHRWG